MTRNKTHRIKGGDPQTKEEWEQYLYDLSVRKYMHFEKNEKKALLKAITDFNIDINKKDSIDGTTYLSKAVLNENTNIVKFFLDETNADPNIIDNGSTLIIDVILLQNIDLLLILLKGGANPNFYDKNTTESPLVYACGFGEKAVKLLIDYGANPNNEHGITPIEYTIQHRKYEVLKILLKNGADPNFDNFVILAAMNKFSNFVILLVENGANVNAIDSHGNNLLMWMSKNISDFEYNEKFLKKIINETDVNHQNKHGNTTLMFYVGQEKDSTSELEGDITNFMVKHLLEKKDIDVNHVDNEGKSVFGFINSYEKGELLLCSGKFRFDKNELFADDYFLLDLLKNYKNAMKYPEIFFDILGKRLKRLEHEKSPYIPEYIKVICMNFDLREKMGTRIKKNKNYCDENINEPVIQTEAKMGLPEVQSYKSPNQIRGEIKKKNPELSRRQINRKTAKMIKSLRKTKKMPLNKSPMRVSPISEDQILAEKLQNQKELIIDGVEYGEGNSPPYGIPVAENEFPNISDMNEPGIIIPKQRV
jgi:ankyrin repeat protein